MTRLIVLTSGKGGVGKTTLSSNLAAALTDFGENVIVMDTNLTTPNLGIHLGMHLTRNTLHDVLKGYSRLKDAIYPHPYGFKVIPAGLSLNDLKGVDVGRLPEVSLNLMGKADYVIMDSAAGLGKEAISALTSSDETIIVTNPDLPSATDALKIISIAKESNVKIIGAVINRVKGNSYELTKNEVENLLKVPIIAEIPEDPNVALSIAAKRPLVEFYPQSPAAMEIKKLAASLSGKKYQLESRKKKGIWKRFFDWLIR
jgi:septum site-determining protein MinD